MRTNTVSHAHEDRHEVSNRRSNPLGRLARTLAFLRETIEDQYESHPTGCGASFGEILCWEIHTNGLTFIWLAEKWGISLPTLGELIWDHCKRLEDLPSVDHTYAGRQLAATACRSHNEEVGMDKDYEQQHQTEEEIEDEELVEEVDMDEELEEVLARFDSVGCDYEQQKQIETLRVAAKRMAGLFVGVCPQGRSKALALTHLEDAWVYAIKAVAKGG